MGRVQFDSTSRMSKPLKHVWFAESVLHRMVRDGEEWFPSETGGVLAGYIVRSHAVVTDAISAGPDAVHNPTSFVPDGDFQSKALDEIYFRTNGVNRYLGDWHTHPLGCGQLSITDR